MDNDLARANAAARIAVELDGQHYRSLIRRADGVVIDQRCGETEVAALIEMLGHLRSIQRWQERTREAAAKD